MQHYVANIENKRFRMEDEIDSQLGVLPLPFAGMDKSGAPVCSLFRMRMCNRGKLCPFRHLTSNNNTVCKHWLRGLCKKGDDCDFLHEYNMARMPECYFFQKFGRCDNKDCQYQHIDPLDKIPLCPDYETGFCIKGPECDKRHRKGVMCVNYMVGFCPLGPKCTLAHPKKPRCVRMQDNHVMMDFNYGIVGLHNPYIHQPHPCRLFNIGLYDRRFARSPDPYPNNRRSRISKQYRNFHRSKRRNSIGSSAGSEASEDQ